MDPVYSVSLIFGSGVLIGSVLLWNFRYLFLQMLVELGFIITWFMAQTSAYLYTLKATFYLVLTLRLLNIFHIL